jgi:hypothetical protein
MALPRDLVNLPPLKMLQNVCTSSSEEKYDRTSQRLGTDTLRRITKGGGAQYREAGVGKYE